MSKRNYEDKNHYNQNNTQVPAKHLETKSGTATNGRADDDKEKMLWTRKQEFYLVIWITTSANHIMYRVYRKQHKTFFPQRLKYDHSCFWRQSVVETPFWGGKWRDAKVRTITEGDCEQCLMYPENIKKNMKEFLAHKRNLKDSSRKYSRTFKSHWKYSLRHSCRLKVLICFDKKELFGSSTKDRSAK